MGQFLGFSDDHSSIVAKICHFSIGYISPQFHLVLINLSETIICNRDDDNAFNTICNYLSELNRNWYAEDEHDDNDKLIYRPPPLEDV